ncbi:MAG: glycosyltransferase family 9 protein [bacterium]|nr:glycosyltransferase family 9 protein [bacterium]
MKLPDDIRRILLIRRRALGDALVTMPAVLEVMRAWPAAQVDLVVDRPFAPLFAGLDERLQVRSWPPRAGSWLATLWGGRYDLVVDWLGNPRTALWSALSGARWRVGYDLPRRAWAYNVRVPRNRTGGRRVRGFAGEAFLDPLRLMGLAPGPWRASLGRQEGAAAEIRLGAVYREWKSAWRPGEKPTVALVMSATWPAKAWPARHVARLAALLIAAGLDPLIVPGPGDESLLAALADEVEPGRLAPPTDLLELADLLEESRLFAGTDCGARHLAAALGRPTVTLFGPTDPAGWNPADPAHVSLGTGADCAPCDLRECPVPGHPCLEDLTPERVAQVIVARIPGPRPSVRKEP